MTRHRMSRDKDVIPRMGEDFVWQVIAGMEFVRLVGWRSGEGSRGDRGTRHSGTLLGIWLGGFGWRKEFCGGFRQIRDVSTGAGLEIAGGSEVSGQIGAENVAFICISHA